MTPLLHAIHHQPWLITPEAHAALCRTAGNAGLFTQPPPPPPDSDLLTIEGGAGIVSISGVLMKRPDLFARVLLGATDIEAAQVEAVTRPTGSKKEPTPPPN